MIKGIQSLTAKVTQVKEIHPGFYDMEFFLPEIARKCEPGQFMMVKPGKGTSPFLGRPMGIYDWDKEKGTVNILFAVKGKGRGTDILAKTKVGDELPVVAPLGRGYRFYPQDKKVIVIAGGMGIASVFPVIKYLNKQNVELKVLMGAHNAGKILATDKLDEMGVEYILYTDDGSAGIKGWPTDTLVQMLHKEKCDRVYCCGTMRMLENTSGICERVDIPCQVSMEERMGCGIGICMGCVCHHRKKDGTRDLARVCYEGPVFDSKEVIWHG